MIYKVFAASLLATVVATSALAANMDVNVGLQSGSKSSGVNVRVGSPPPPTTIIVEKERTVVVKEKHDQGKHKGQKKHKKHKGEKHD
jgi:hypothetical protein